MANVQLDQVLEMAVGQEVAAARMYSELAAKVQDPSTKDTLLFLAREEAQHRLFLENYRKGKLPAGTLGLHEPIDAHMVETFGAPEWDPSWDPREAFLVAARKEKESNQFYQDLAKVHPEGEIRDLLLRLAKEELGHKEKMECLYANAAFVQTDGG
jgi:rubrerythrin